ncbi:MAG: asparaginase [Acidimicrobiia bacterium]|nr:asparaginase [Acidimicrobiia bacterium]
MIAVVTRSGLDEAFHDGCVVAVGPDGGVIGHHGDADRVFFVRSSAKPFQAATALELGAELPPEHLALACASHDGSPTHIAIVQAMLEAGGLGESDLGCPPSRPLGESADREWARAGSIERRRIFHNCSGKHAAMLRACVAQGWPTATYLQPEHPLQQAMLRTMDEVGMLAGTEVGVDGCGAPVFRVSARRLAAAFAGLESDRFRQVWTAMHRFPVLVSGPGNADAEIAVALDAVAKRGAEGLLAIAVRGRGALVIRCWDGSDRPLAVAALAAMEQLGWVNEKTPFLDRLRRPVRGGGTPVGSVRAVFELESE